MKANGNKGGETQKTATGRKKDGGERGKRQRSEKKRKVKTRNGEVTGKEKVKGNGRAR